MDRRTADSLDHWLTTPPEDRDPREPEVDDCKRCEATLPTKPDKVVGNVYYDHCVGHGPLTGAGLAHLMACDPCAVKFSIRDNFVPACETTSDHQPHVFSVAGWDIEYRTCKCGHVNTQVQA